MYLHCIYVVVGLFTESERTDITSPKERVGDLCG
jgi:hypothetical protein